jgi:hypothetical protein
MGCGGLGATTVLAAGALVLDPLVLDRFPADVFQLKAALDGELDTLSSARRARAFCGT